MEADAAPALADASPSVDAMPAPATTIYLNFGGQLVQVGDVDNASQNKSQLITEATTITAFDASAFTNTAPQDEFVAAVVEQVRAYYEPYDVAVVTERPASGGYAMAVIGGNPQDVGLLACTDPDPACSLGTAWLDCAPFPSTEPGDLIYNENGDGAIVFVFAEVFAKFSERTLEESVKRIAATTAHELGHSFGLAHVLGDTCLMNRDSTGLATGFCSAPFNQEDGHCGPGSIQDAPAILNSVFVPDGV
jgi:hypothetical protein